MVLKAEHTQTSSSHIVMGQPSCDRLKGRLRDKATSTVITSAISVDGSGTRGLGLRSVKGDPLMCVKLRWYAEM